MRDAVRLNKIEWRYIVIDEAQRMKDSKSKLSRDLTKFKVGGWKEGRMHTVPNAAGRPVLGARVRSRAPQRSPQFDSWFNGGETSLPTPLAPRTPAASPPRRRTAACC